MAFLTCQSCARHVKADSAACPFCGSEAISAPVAPTVRSRVTRAVLVAGAATVAVACSSSTVALYGAPYIPPDGGQDSSAEAGKDSGVPDAPIAAYGGPFDSSVPMDAGKD